MKRLLIPLIILLLALPHFELTAQSGACFGGCGTPQIVNDYLAVEDFNDACPATIVEVDETELASSDFSVGDVVLIIQMKGSQSPGTGVWASIQNAGRLEWAIITDILSGGQIVLDRRLENRNLTPLPTDFDPSEQNPSKASGSGTVQIVRAAVLPSTTSVNTITGCVTGEPWDPTTGTGGLVVYYSPGDIEVEGMICAAGLGFRGGASNAAGWCLTAPFNVIDNTTGFTVGGKGEGIVEFNPGGTTLVDFNGQQNTGTGGGGGALHNSGGGGGGGYRPGGDGGFYSQICNPTIPQITGGLGGSGFPPSNALLSNPRNTMFLGGGGGGGHVTDHTTGNTPRGGNGGGIVIIWAEGTITFDGGHIDVSGEAGIASNNGLAGATAGDGGGGGGGGGSICLQQDAGTALNIAGGTFDISGGSGAATGPAGTNSCEGPGGGGGAGVLFISDGITSGTSTPATVNIAAGPAGVQVFGPCANGNHGAQAGSNNGQVRGYGDMPGTNYTPIEYEITAATSEICAPYFFNLSVSPVVAGNTYQWSGPSGPLASTAPTLNVGPTTVADNGMYYVTVTNTDGCEFTDEFDMSVLPAPDVEITGGPLNLCPGQSYTFTGPPSGDTYNYEWFLNGSPTPVSTTNTYSGNTTGTLSVQIIVNGNTTCIYQENFNIGISEDCCFASGSSDFPRQEQADRTLSADEVWSGKVFIQDNVFVSVPSGITLDLTNVDIIFGENAGINVIDGNIRANNSVFRPCDETSTWRGFYFTDGATGQFNESLFKNALIAVWGQGNASVKVSNNEFSNCLNGIQIESMDAWIGAISGNTFLVDDRRPSVFDATGYCGIRVISSFMFSPIAQNDFIKTAASEPDFAYHGIQASHSVTNIIGNHFTDLHRSIDVSGASLTVIESNVIETGMLNPKEDGSYQIRISQSEGSGLIEVFGNVLRNSTVPETSGEYNTLTLSEGAIYIEESSLLSIRDNEIIGFEIGIMIQESSEVIVTNNMLDENIFIGVAVVNGSANEITCNTIDMDYFESRAGASAQKVGIYYQQTEESATAELSIRSNCILETQVAIELITNKTNQVIPELTNNFLYNYTAMGVYSGGFTGSIGTTGSYANSGRNTFYSNQKIGGAAGALDVFSLLPGLNVSNNFGVLHVSGATVNDDPGQTYHSSASCAMQVENPANLINEITAEEVCMERPYLEVEERTAGEFKLAEDYVELLNALSSDQVLIHSLADMRLLASSTNYTDMQVLYEYASGLLYGNQRVWLEYGYLNSLGLISSAAETLIGIVPESVEEADLVSVETIRMNLSLTNRSVLELTSEELDILLAIESSNSTIAPVARDLIHLNQGQHDYQFKTLAFTKVESPEASTYLQDDFISIMPNPATDEIKLHFNMIETDEVQIKVYSLSGEVLMNSTSDYNSSIVKLNVSTLPEGMYLLTVENDRGDVMTGKFGKN